MAEKSLQRRGGPSAMMDPFSQLRSQMNRLFEDFTGGSMLSREWPMMGGQQQGSGYLPSIDLSEDAENLYVTTELPGIKPEDVDIRLQRDVLTISGEKKREKREDKHDFHRVERSWGAFRRQVRLPTEVDPDKCNARFEDGVLTIKMHKAGEGNRSRRIEIGRG